MKRLTSPKPLPKSYPLKGAGLYLALALFLLIGSFGVPQPTAKATPAAQVPDERYARMAHGVNLAFWFWFGPQTEAELEARFSDEEFAGLQAMGFTYVRLPIDLNFLMDESAPDLLRESGLTQLDRAIERLNAAGLAVMVDVHSTSLEDAANSVYSGRLEDDPDFVRVFLQFWGNLAAHLRDTTSPDWVFLEPMNEPVFEENPTAWWEIQADLLRVIRQNAPDHTLIATAHSYSNLYALAGNTPYPDPNIVYNFHYYEPFLFTHQGADWTWEGVRPLNDIPYPSSPENIAPLLRFYNDPQTQGYLIQYGEENWDAARIQADIDHIADWGEQHGVRLLCNEFGVYSRNAPIESRLQWIEDVRTALENRGIGWAMWEYDDSFGFVLRSGNNNVVIIRDVVRALGLNP